MLFGHRLFASSLTCALFCVFLAPILTTLHLVADENVRFWIGWYPLFSLLMPVLWLAAHAYHMSIGYGKRSVLMTCVIIPCVVFFLIGGSILFQATHVVDGLLTQDCPHFRAIRPVEQAYQDANSVLAECRKEKPDAILQNCQNYVDEYDVAAHGKYWSYLQFVETNYNCHGFCTSRPDGLWSRGGVTNDACAVAVASVLRGRVQHAAWQLMMYNIIVLFAFLGWLSFLSYYEGGSSPVKRATGPLLA